MKRKSSPARMETMYGFPVSGWRHRPLNCKKVSKCHWSSSQGIEGWYLNSTICVIKVVPLERGEGVISPIVICEEIENSGRISWMVTSNLGSFLIQGLGACWIYRLMLARRVCCLLFRRGNVLRLENYQTGNPGIAILRFGGARVPWDLDRTSINVLKTSPGSFWLLTFIRI